MSMKRSRSSTQFSEHDNYFEDALGPMENLESLQQFLGSYGEPCDVQTNTPNQSAIASSSIDAQRKSPQAQQSLHHCSDDVLRGATDYAKIPGPIRAGNANQTFLNIAAASSYNTHRKSHSATSQRPAFMSISDPPAATAESSEVYSTRYGPYRGLFLDSNAARDHRHLSTQFGRQPYIHPEDDLCIAEVENTRIHQVGRIYDAMIRGDRAQDNPGSIAMKRWVSCAHYKPDLVEAFAHKVFDCLLVQVKEGFRGWHHNDYVDDDRKGEKEDREADCMGRLENIVDALEREKTICEDVVNSASQIRMFVNAPIAYAARKYQNRLGNSKRGRTKDTPESNLRPAKARRTGGRQNRARSTTASDIPTSRDTTPQFQTTDTTAMPYYMTPTSPQFQSSPTSTHLAPRQSLHKTALPMSQVPSGYRHPTGIVPAIVTRPTSSSTTSRPAMSPPMVPTTRPYNAHATRPRARMIPTQTSPLTLHPSYHSAPPSPDNARCQITASPPARWPNANPFDNTNASTVDPSLIANDLFTQQPWADELTPSRTVGRPNYLDQQQPATYVSLDSIERAPLQFNDIEDPTADLESLWNAQPGVQSFYFDGLGNSDLGH